MEKELREFIRDYLDGTNSEAELISKFDIKKCEICGSYNLEEDLIDTESTKGIGTICESCLEDSKE